MAKINQAWLLLIEGQSVEVEVHIKVIHPDTKCVTVDETLTLCVIDGQTLFVRASTAPMSNFLGQSLFLSQLRGELSLPVMTNKQKCLLRILSWRFGAEIAEFKRAQVYQRSERRVNSTLPSFN